MTASKPDGRATRWNRHKAERRALILDAAVTVVAREGGTVSVRDIADQAGVPRSVVYRIFRDREDLDEQLRAEILARLMAVLEPTLEPSGTVQEAICDAVTTYVDWVSDNQLLHQFLGTGSAGRPTTGSRAVTGTRTAIARQVTTMLAAAATDTGADPAIAEPVAFGLVGLVDGAVNRWIHSASERVPADQLAAFLADAVWAVLEKQTATWGRAITPDTRIADLGT
jgi:AcrR family transcriptional regulator